MKFAANLAVVGLAALGLASAANAGNAGFLGGVKSLARPNLVVNGGFEQTAKPQSSEFGDRFPEQQVVGWQTSGYNWVYRPGEADTVGGNGEFGFVSLWGPGNGSNNGLPAQSPLGGNFLAADGAFVTSAITQQLSGLVPGQRYVISFTYAGAQQFGFEGATTDRWAVNLGPTIPTDDERRNGSFASTVQLTPLLTLASRGFSGWQTARLTFTAQTANDTLSFLAIGTPDGVPPFALLDGVTAQEAIPEASTWALLVAGFGLIGFAARRRRALVAA